MKETIFLGTYTKRESKGIYQIQLDTEKKELTNLHFIARADSPTYLALSGNKEILYAISKENGEGGLVSFKKNERDEFVPVDAVTAEGAPPCYVSVDDDRSFVYTANYHKGEIAVLKTDAAGHLTLLDTVKHTGSSVHENQQSPHAHYSDLTPDGTYLVACDLGTDAVYTYAISEKGKLTEVSRFDTAPGAGPRHLVFHPNGKFAYIFAELSSEIITVSYEPETGAFSHIQTLSTIPVEHTGFNGGAAIRISNDGRFVYASNRGHDSIAVFAVSTEDGSLKLIERVPSEGQIPRDFDFDPSGKFAVVAHQDSDNLTLFERNEESGKLTLIQKDVYAPECVCVFFE
ncbi:MAG: lactonase family protein [Carnobacterium sp.]|uniref:lactonase family protein n=1 Tax=Carnobacterium sp. TaxID=48221 RepID=UPI002FC6B909